MAILRVVVLAVLLAASTMFLGWWSVPVVAALYAGVRREQGASIESGLAALIAWSALFARLAFVPATPRLLHVLSGIFPVPAVALMIVAVLFAAGLAWSAARCVVGLGANRKSVAARVNQE